MSDSDDKPQSNDSEAVVHTDDSFPTAVVDPETSFDLVRGSKLWLLTFLCALAAVGLSWYSLPEKGTEIEIQFPQGHGLKPEDEVRHRGISVGIVKSIELNSELSGITVQVSLRPGAESLAREGSRFWIVRPEFSLSGISGLDTAVGSKYIAVDPGEESAAGRFDFVGLATEPADAALEGEGIEIVLRGDETHSITSGSPVTWRGVQVGRVTSIGLSPDARYADIHARIRSPYTKLLRGNSKFWATSGVDLDFSFKGVKMNAESLETIARGGVSFITLDESTSANSITAGHVFTLHDKADKTWTQDAESVRLIETRLPSTASVVAQWRANGLALTRRREVSGNAIAVTSSASSDSVRLIIPTDLLKRPQKMEPETFAVSVTFPSSKQNEAAAINIPEAEKVNTTTSPVMIIPVLSDVNKRSVASVRDFRIPDHPEDCWIVKSAISNDGVVTVHQAIGRHELTDFDISWQLDSSKVDHQKWHGAPVVSLEDGKIIGILIVNKSKKLVKPITQKLLDSINK